MPSVLSEKHKVNKDGHRDKKKEVACSWFN